MAKPTRARRRNQGASDPKPRDPRALADEIVYLADHTADRDAASFFRDAAARVFDGWARLNPVSSACGQ